MEIDELLKTNNWFNYQEFYEWVSKKPFKTFVEVGNRRYNVNIKKH
jgi:hypothetical protein